MAGILKVSLGERASSFEIDRILSNIVATDIFELHGLFDRFSEDIGKVDLISVTDSINELQKRQIQSEIDNRIK